MKNRLLPLLFLPALVVFASNPSAVAQNSTWLLDPVSSDWNTNANWTANVPYDTATFDVSHNPQVFVSLFLTGVNRIVFSPGASSFDISVLAHSTLDFSGEGIVNNSGIVQNFRSSRGEDGFQGEFIFLSHATAGDHTTFTTVGGATGDLQFQVNSNAGKATIVNQGSTTESGPLGVTGFFNQSNAKQAVITNQGGQASGAGGGLTLFASTARASDAVITGQGSGVAGGLGGRLEFYDDSSADAATLIAEAGANGGGGGEIHFFDRARGQTATVKLFGNGFLDVTFLEAQATIGSLEGDGHVLLLNTLNIGSNNLSTNFSGLLEENPGFGPGAIKKIGRGTLTLAGANTYTGGTIISGGRLLVENSSGSATGAGAVQVSAGTLGGSGIISGPVIVGTGNGVAVLAPAVGTGKQATLKVESTLIFNSDASYIYTFKARPNAARTDRVIANGVTINEGASMDLSGQTQGTLTQGTVYPVITNTSASAIDGTFINLPDGGIVNVNGNNLQASYSGGDGNDLTLTVVP
ncbi:MAG: autotransporter-associated beta strand repeat-containing protein [Chthoniobacterales bacterium]